MDIKIIIGLVVGILLLLIAIGIALAFYIKKSKAKIEPVFNNKESIQLFKETNPHLTDDMGNTQLHISAQYNYASSCLYIIHKIKVEIQEKNLTTFHSKLEIGKYLDKKNCENNTALHLACKFFNDDIAKIILMEGGSPNSQNHNGDTPLHLAIKNDMKKTIKELLHRDADVNVVNNQGETPLSLAKRYKIDLTKVRTKLI